MKKFITIFLVSLACFFLFSPPVLAVDPGYAPGCTAPNNQDPDTWDMTANPPKAKGLVPCGVGKNADGTLKCPCAFGHLFAMILRVYSFILFDIATPLAGLLVVIGGVMMMVSAGNPALMDRGKGILKGAVWGIFLIFGAWLMVKIILLMLGINVDPGSISF